MLDTIPHISSPYSATWVVWLLLGLMVAALLNRSSRMDIALTLRTIFSRSERYYSTQTQSWSSSILTGIFEWSVVALTAYLLMYNGGVFGIVSFLKVMGIVAVVYFLQWISVVAVGNVFLQIKTYTNATEQYLSLRAMACILLYPLLIIAVNIPSTIVLKIATGIVAAIYLLLLLIKMVMLFYRNIGSLIYILLYITYLEIIPTAGLLLWTKTVVG